MSFKAQRTHAPPAARKGTTASTHGGGSGTPRYLLAGRARVSARPRPDEAVPDEPRGLLVLPVAPQGISEVVERHQRLGVRCPQRLLLDRQRLAQHRQGRFDPA